MSEAEDLKYVGTRPIRPDGVEKVTGRANFGADETMPGMVYGQVVRSPYAHAKIRSIDTSKAEAIPGVVAVITAQDFPDRSKFSLRRKMFNDNIIASDKVVYHGHAVAAVAATSTSIARLAGDAIEVDYDVLEPVVDVLKAMDENAPLLHEGLYTEGLPEKPLNPSNISNTMTISRGDAEKAFADADEVVERTFVTPMVHQGYIEPHA